MNGVFDFDTHTHSMFSFDGENSAKQMVERAALMNMKVLVFTEHLDVNEYENPFYKMKPLLKKAAVVIPELKKEYNGKLELLFGLELGQSVWDSKTSKGLVNKIKNEAGGIDYILGSVHAVRGWEDFYYLDYSKFDYYDLLKRYFNEIYETAQQNEIDSIAHLTYPIRYITGRQGLECDISRFDGIIEKIFKVMVKNETALEINTAGLRKNNYAKTDPDLKYIKMFRELGGKHITVGSDAHNVDNIGSDIDEGLKLASLAGFKNVVYYKNRKPIEIPIDS